MKQFKVIKVMEISSTNQILKESAKQGEILPFSVLIAEKQTCGHGQYGRTFESPVGGLYMSVYLKKQLPYNTDDLTKKIGKLLQEVIAETCKLDTQIKEPNDILYNGKKLCGTLVESFTFDGFLHIIIGIGLNLNTNIKDFSDEIKNQADSISHILSKNVDSDFITESILNKITEVLEW